MANRDLFYGDYQRQDEVRRGSALWSRLMLQGLVAVLMFAGVLALYEQESRLGEGVRYVVALARADNSEVLAVSSLKDVDWQGLVAEIGGQESADLSGNSPDDKVQNEVQGNTPNNTADVEVSAADFVPGDDYLSEAAQNADGKAVLVLPASGLMQAAFGDLGADGLTVDGVEIFCQQQQAVKAAAIGRVTEAAADRIVLEHSGGLETVYAGEIAAAVSVGDVVQQGEQLGTLPEGVLTFQVLVEGEPQDPLGFVLGPE